MPLHLPKLTNELNSARGWGGGSEPCDEQASHPGEHDTLGILF